MQKWYFLHLCDIVLYINPKGNISKDILFARGIWREDGCMQRWLTGESCSVSLPASSSVGCKCKEHHQAILLNSPPSYPSTATASYFFFPCAAFCSVHVWPPQMLSKLCQCALGQTPPGWRMCHAHAVRVMLLTRLAARQGFLSFKFEYLHWWLLTFDPFDTVFCLLTISGQIYGQEIQYMENSNGETVKKVCRI